MDIVLAAINNTAAARPVLAAALALADLLEAEVEAVHAREACAGLDLARERIADTAQAQAHVAELV